MNEAATRSAAPAIEKMTRDERRQFVELLATIALRQALAGDDDRKDDQPAKRRREVNA